MAGRLRQLLSSVLPPSLFNFARALSRESDRQRKEEACRQGLRFLERQYPQLGLTLLDIGARDGVPEGEIPGLSAFPRTRIFGIEPDADEARRLEQSREPLRHEKVFPVAVWNSSESQQLNVTAHSGCASILQPDEQKLAPYAVAGWFKVVRQMPVQLTTLDELFSQGETFDFIKIDVQGGELYVFLGGERVLSSATGLVFEGHMVPLYQKQQTFDIVHAYCTSLGFRLISLQPAQSFDGEVVELNCAYVRAPAGLADAPAFLKALAFSLLIYNRDYAEFLLRNHGRQHLGEDKLAALLVEMKLELQRPRPIPPESRSAELISRKSARAPLPPSG